MGAVTKGFLHNPSERNLRPRHAAGGGNRCHLFDDLAVGFGRGSYSLLPYSSVRVRAVSRLPRARQAPAGERAPGHDGDPLIGAQRQHFALFFAVQQIVVILHADEGCPAVLPREVQGLAELPGVHGGGAEVARLAGS